MGNKTAGDKLKSFRIFYLFCTILLVFALASGCNSGGRSGADGSWSPLPNASEIDEIVTGVITDSDGNGVVGAEVRFLKNDVVVQSVKTTTGGKFQALLAPGTYDVVVIQDNYAPTEQVFVVEAKLANTLNAVVSSTVGVLSGVVSNTNGTPVVGAKVSVTASSLQISPVYTDSAGVFKFNLPPGNYTVSVSLEGYDYEDPSGSVLKTILADSIVMQDFRLSQTNVRIHGLVTNKSGQIQAGTLVRLVPFPSETPIQSYTIGEDGWYSFLATPGTFELRANKDGFQGYKSDKITLVRGAELLHDIKLELPSPAPIKGVIKGIVKLSTTGETLPNIHITLYSGDGENSLEESTSTVQGGFAFENRDPGDYKILLKDDSNAYRVATYTVNLLSDGTLLSEDGKTPEFFLSPMVYDDLSQKPPMAVVTGVVRDSFTKTPLQYVNCMLKSVRSCISDLNGNFSFDDLIPGSYEIVFSKPSWQDLVVTFVVKANDDGSASIYPPILNCEMVQKQETDVGAIVGRYSDENTGLGVNGLVVRLYKMSYVLKTIRSIEAGEVTYVDKAMWEVDEWPIVSTRTGDNTIGSQQYAGSFRFEHVRPTVPEKTTYVVYVGEGSSYLPTRLAFFPVDNTVTWRQPDFNPSVADFVHIWGMVPIGVEDVPVIAQTTTYLYNYAQPYTVPLLNAFSFPAIPADSVIDHINKTVAVTVPSGTDVSSLVATFAQSVHSNVYVGGVLQVSGTTANDFSSPKTYRLISSDNTVRDYLVTVTVAAP
ncbi:MAG: hypothetical protein EOM80_14945 [Erysipelotrichia bacterium]|nr:hypothetical protein [Erysipelotrichia bacterium]